MNFINYYDNEKVFVLNTQNSTYQMQIEKYGVLIHLYYGITVGDTLITNRIVKKDRGFCGNPNEAGNDRSFSLDILPQEYSGFGNGDYRTSAIEIVHNDGSNIADLRYISHKIYAGKYALDGLPAAQSSEQEAETLEITMKDQATDVEVILYYSVIPKRDIITRAVKICNNGKNNIIIKRAMSMQIDFDNCNMDMIDFYGQHCMERTTQRHLLHHGIQSIGSTRGTSSHHYNPFFILCDKDSTEDYGQCYGISLLYSGNFLGEVEVDQVGQTRVVLGIHPFNFSYQLKPSEEFTTPEVILACSNEGLSGLSKIFHRAYIKNVCRGIYAGKRRPILINNWEATYFDFDNDKLYAIAKEAKEVGIEMLVMDDGWFGKRDSDVSGLGDWTVNTNKLKEGLPELIQKINKLGLKFGIWIEPEMISEDSDLYRNHPQWCLKIPQRPANRSRYQLNLDITRKDVRDYIMDSLFTVFDNCNIEYIKWDMNRSLSNVYSMNLPPERQGEVYHRYVLGLYDMLERLITRYPKLLLESCSGGGGRFDGGMLYYSPQIWCSDNTDAIERLKIQYGTSFGYPISAIGSHVSACPNHQTGRTTPFDTRAVVAMAGTFGFELDLEKLTQEEKQIAQEQVKEYKEIAQLVLTGDYYRLTNPFENNRYTLWQFVSQDLSESIVRGVQQKVECNGSVQIIKLKGLDINAHYKIQGYEKIYTGAALMYAGITMPDMLGDYQSIKMHIIRI